MRYLSDHYSHTSTKFGSQCLVLQLLVRDHKLAEMRLASPPYLNEPLIFRYLVAGNKIDLESERQVMKEQGETFARNNDAPFFEVSAKSKENIEPLFDETIRRALKYLEGSKPPSKAKANNRGCMLQ
jgi:GTPase SAR1 family protein